MTEEITAVKCNLYKKISGFYLGKKRFFKSKFNTLPLWVKKLSFISILGLLIAAYQVVTNDDPEILSQVKVNTKTLDSIKENQYGTISRTNLSNIVKEIVCKLDELPGKNKKEPDFYYLSNRYFPAMMKNSEKLEQCLTDKLLPIYEKDLPTYYRAKAIAFAELGLIGKIFENLNKGLEVSPNNPAILYERGITYILFNKLDQAKEDLKSAEKILSINHKTEYPAMLSIHLALSGIAYNKGKFLETYQYDKEAFTVMNESIDASRIDYIFLMDNIRDNSNSVSSKKGSFLLKIRFMMAASKIGKFDEVLTIYKSLESELGNNNFLDEIKDLQSLKLVKVVFLLQKNEILEAEILLHEIGANPNIRKTMVYILTRGLLFAGKQKWKKALNHFERIEYMYDNGNKELELSEIYAAIQMKAFSYLLLGDFENAKKSKKKLDDIANKTGSKKDLFKAAYTYCLIYFLENDKSKLQDSVNALEGTYDLTDEYSAMDRSLMLQAKALLARLDCRNEQAIEFEKLALEFAERDNSMFTLYTDSLRSLIKSENIMCTQ